MKNKIDNFGNKRWYNEKNQLHREDGPAMIWEDGSKFWWLNGLKHREDGPAIEYSNGDKIWYFNGKYHRRDGPAIEWEDGYKSWYYHGKRIDCQSQEEFERIILLKTFE